MKDLYTPDRRDFLKLGLTGALGVMTQRYARAQAPQMQMAISQKRVATSGIALVQQAVGTSADGSSTLTVPFGTPTTEGNLVVVCASYPSATSFAIQPNLDRSGTLNNATENSSTNITEDIYALISVGGDESVSARLTDPLTRLNIHVSEWTLISSDVAEDANGNSNTGLTSVVATGSVTPASARNLVIGMGAWIANDYSSGPAGFSRMTPTGGVAIWQEVGYLIQSSAVAAATSWNLTVGIEWDSAIVAFGGT